MNDYTKFYSNSGLVDSLQYQKEPIHNISWIFSHNKNFRCAIIFENFEVLEDQFNFFLNLRVYNNFES